MISSNYVLPWVPSQNPGRWLAINALCLAYTIIISLVLVFGADGVAEDMLFARRNYLLYDCTLCVIWLAEIGLTVWHVRFFLANEDSNSLRGLNWALTIELCLAVYFATSSVYLLFCKWDPDESAAKQTSWLDLSFDIGVNLLAYLYMTHELSKKMRERNELHAQEDGHYALASGDYGATTSEGRDFV